MKPIPTIIFFILLSGCGYGQHPKAAINKEGEIYNANAYTQTQFDSTKYYYRQFVKYNDKWGAAINKLNETHNGKYVKEINRYMDSTTKYHDLIMELKNKN